MTNRGPSSRASAACRGTEHSASCAPPHSGDPLLISIIVPVHHQDTFFVLLESLAKQHLVPRSAFEVIVVSGAGFAFDAARFDALTSRVGNDFHCSYHDIGSPSGRARAINFGLSRAKAPIIWLLADDFIPGPEALSAHLRFHANHRDPRDAGVGGGFFPSRLRKSFLRRMLEDSGSLFGHSFTSPLGGFASNFFYAANTSIKRSLIDRAGTFNERFHADAWDDYEYAQRLIPLGYRATYLADARCTHEHRVNLSERMEHLRNAGHAAVCFESLHPTMIHPWRNSVRNTLPSLPADPPRIRHDEWKRLGNFERLRLIRRLLDRAFAEGYVEAEKVTGRRLDLLSLEIVDTWLKANAPVATDRPQDMPVTAHANPQRMQEALRMQRARNLRAAERLYWDELQENPRCADALHMFGVIRLEAGFPAQASEFLTRALRAGAGNRAIKGNLGLCLGELLRAKHNRGFDGNAATPLRAFQTRRASSRNPLVSVIIPSYNHRQYLGAALSSVFAQRYRDVEIIVIDDGSKDGSPQLLKDLMRYSPFPVRLITRENRGAHHTINEAIGLARGEYVNVLNSDDAFPATRLGHFVQLMKKTGSPWGFGKVSIQCDNPDALQDQRTAATLAGIQLQSDDHPTLGSSLLRQNIAISSGNLFVQRDFAIACGLFRDFRYNHDWDFCLRALWHAEPAYLPEIAYLYRLHGGNTIKEAREAASAEADAILCDYIGRALSDQQAPNPAAPCMRNWGEGFLSHCLEGGLGRLFSTESLLAMKQTLAPTDGRGKRPRAARIRAASQRGDEPLRGPLPSPRIGTSPQ